MASSTRFSPKELRKLQLLANASAAELKNWELLGDGDGIHWPDLDEDLSVAGLLIGTH